jgi:D-alanine-D-alanine ligase
MDKWRTKLVWQCQPAFPCPTTCAAGCSASNFAAVEASASACRLFVKPANEGSSIGITKVKDAGKLA